VDCTPFNILQDASGGFHAFDLEYISDRPLPLDAVVFRGLWQSFARIHRCAPPDVSVPDLTLDVVTSIMAKCEMPIEQKRVNELIRQEAELQSTIRGLRTDLTLRAFAVERLPLRSGAVRHERTDEVYSCQVYWRAENEPYDESRSRAVSLPTSRVMQQIDLPIPALDSIGGLRLDLADRTGVLEVAAITLADVYGHEIRNWSAREIAGACSRGMRSFLNGGDDEGVTVFVFTDDPGIELPLDSSVAVGCLGGGLLRVTCRWPVEHYAIERILGGTAELLRRTSQNETNGAVLSGIQAQLTVVNEQLERIADVITRNDDITGIADITLPSAT
jgi:hypothetical protein